MQPIIEPNGRAVLPTRKGQDMFFKFFDPVPPARKIFRKNAAAMSNAFHEPA